MTAFFVLFHAMASRVATAWPLAFDLSRSQSGLRIATTAAPVRPRSGGAPLAVAAQPAARCPTCARCLLLPSLPCRQVTASDIERTLAEVEAERILQGAGRRAAVARRWRSAASRALSLRRLGKL